MKSFEEECRYIHRVSNTEFHVNKGLVDNMKVPGKFYADEKLEKLVFEELRNAADNPGAAHGGFIPAIKQLANVAALPGIVKYSIALPDVHAGYGFAIGKSCGSKT